MYNIIRVHAINGRSNYTRAGERYCPNRLVSSQPPKSGHPTNQDTLICSKCVLIERFQSNTVHVSYLALRAVPAVHTR